jgi:hypothetical protein
MFLKLSFCQNHQNLVCLQSSLWCKLRKSFCGFVGLIDFPLSFLILFPERWEGGFSQLSLALDNSGYKILSRVDVGSLRSLWIGEDVNALVCD